MWHDGDRPWPQWRVSYVKDTGEVYAVEQAGQLRVRMLGVVPADPVSDGGKDVYYATLDKVLAGWAEPGLVADDVVQFDLVWVEQRLDPYAVPAEPA